MKNFLLLSLIVLTVISCTGKKSARIHGTLTPPGMELQYDGDVSLISKTGIIKLKTDAEGNFDTIIPLDKPQYYSLFRNPIYLSPGDDLEVVLIDAYPEKSIFRGKGAEANNYLKERFYAKGGSYLDAGGYMDVELEKTIPMLDAVVARRSAELAELKNVSKEFKEIETARIKADYINSLFYFPSYQFSKVATKPLTREEYDQNIKEYHDGIKDRIEPLLKDISSDDRYLDIEVVRLVLYRAMDMGNYQFTRSDRFETLIKVATKANRLKREVTPEIYNEMKSFGDSITYPEMKKVFMERLESTTKLMTGRPAQDFRMEDKEGNPVKLSDYKGEVIYVDFWATWCGPCRMESPYFKALSEEFKNIRFLAVSTDEKRSNWETYLKEKGNSPVVELLSVDPELKNRWNINGIPRFLLIDKDFNIIMSAAPRPSESDKIRPLLEQYN